MLQKIKKFTKSFKEVKFLSKLPSYAKLFGVKTLYTILLLYNAYQRTETPTWAKNVILGVLGYLLAPIDGVPDLTPFVGFTDDIGVLSFGLVTIASYINKEVKEKSKKQLTSWFKTVDLDMIKDVDDKL